MSLDALSWGFAQQIAKNSRASQAACKLVLLSLCDRANEAFECFPSITRLEYDTQLNRKTINAALAHLREAGLIVDTGLRRGRTQKVIVYRLVGPTPREGVIDPNLGQLSTPAKPRNKKQTSPKTGRLNKPKSGTVPNLPENKPKNGPIKQAQKRASEPVSLITSKEPGALPTDESASEEFIDQEELIAESGRKLGPNQSRLFRMLWNEFGLKRNRAASIDAFLTHVWPGFGKCAESNRERLEFWCDKIRKHAKTRTKDRPGPYFDAWLNKRRWEDDYTTEQRLGSSYMSDESRAQMGRPHWDLAGFNSFEHWQKFQGLASDVKRLEELKKPSFRDREHLFHLREELERARPKKPKLEKTGS